MSLTNAEDVGEKGWNRKIRDAELKASMKQSHVLRYCCSCCG